MMARPAILLLFAAVFVLPACRPAPPTQAPAATPPVVRAYTQFSPGDTVDLMRIQLGLDKYEVRYRTSMPADLMGMVYFLDDGNLHIDARRVGGTWVLISVPLLDPSSASAEDRVADWDRGADKQNLGGRSEK